MDIVLEPVRVCGTMKNNMITTIFLALFLVSTALNVWVILNYNSSIHKLQQLKGNSMAVLPVIQQLLNESIEYSKTHPDMAHYLQGTSGGAPKAVPAAKPNK